MLSVANKAFMLGVIRLNDVMLSVVILIVFNAERHLFWVSQKTFMLSVNILNVVMLSVVAPGHTVKSICPREY